MTLPPLSWILLSGLLMSAVALVGAFTLLISDDTLDRLLIPFVGLAAGSLLGGALFHLLPAGLAALDDPRRPFVWVTLGFTTFLLLETTLHRHHCRNATAPCREPVTYLILIGDALHNLIGGLAVGGAFVADVRLGITAWLAALAHEVPQELGDFAVLVRGGWPKKRALAFNFLSALTFLLGSLLSYAASFEIDVSFLLPFAAGNFIYIAASDLVPELSRAHPQRQSATSLVTFALALLLLYSLA
jgi:zinc and cadmium transporter